MLPDMLLQYLPDLSYILTTPSSQEAARAAAIYGAYLLFMVLGGIVLPGKVHEGTDLKYTDGTNETYRLKYKCNGLYLYLSVCAIFCAGVKHGFWSGTIVYDNIRGLFWVINAFVIVLSLVLYIKGKVAPEHRMKPTFSGNVVKDLWLGVELNPHILGLDVKFLSYRPSMAGWTMINISLAYTQMQMYGDLSYNMIAYQIFSFWYVFDYFWHERLMITTWDIIAENFGYMLVWGDHIFITFVFSLQSWFLLNHPSVGVSRLLVPYLYFCFSVFLCGYLLFRSANAQKAKFRFTRGDCTIWGEKAKFLETERGTKLLLSGWWGYARHLNYTGDILIALGMSLPCMNGSLWAYSYPMYLVLLLLHRAKRDDRECQHKYKKDWDRYCALVPYVFVPGVY